MGFLNGKPKEPKEGNIRNELKKVIYEEENLKIEFDVYQIYVNTQNGSKQLL